MKFKYLPVLLMSFLAITLVSCSDDDDDNRIVNPVESAKHFTGDDLELTLSGNKVTGKDVLYTPDETNPSAATLTFLGQSFDLNAAMNGGMRAEQAMGLPTSSIFAGEAQVVVPITMNVQGDMGTFEGNGESKYYTFSYKGSVIENKLSVSLSDVALKNTKLAGTAWKVEPIRMNEWGMAENSPLITNWESDKKLAIDMFGQTTEYDMSQILTLVIGLPLIDAGDKKVSVAEMIGNILQEVKFENDGNIQATYIDMKSKQPKVSPYGLAQYVVVDDAYLKLILNPFIIAADAAQNKKEETSENPMSEIMKILAPDILKSIEVEKKLTEGIDIHYAIKDNKMQAYVDETLILPMLKVFIPMIQNPDMIAAAVEMVKKNPDMAAMAPMIESVLKQLPDIIQSTKKMEIGINFEKK